MPNKIEKDLTLKLSTAEIANLTPDELATYNEFQALRASLTEFQETIAGGIADANAILDILNFRNESQDKTTD